MRRKGTIFFAYIKIFCKKSEKNLRISKKSSTFAPAFRKNELDGVFWGPRKFRIFGESENTAKIHMSDGVANRIEP
jgi:hypothetical protein